jgi:hypothetical protein
MKQGVALEAGKNSGKETVCTLRKPELYYRVRNYPELDWSSWVFGRSLTRIVGLNLAGGMDVCLLWVLFVVR